MPKWSVVAYHPERGIRTDVGRDEIAAVAAEGWHLWIDMEEPVDGDVLYLQRTFQLHPLAVEDALHQSQRPKIDVYQAHSFLVVYAAGQGNAELREVDAFCGDRYIALVHDEPVPDLDAARQRWLDSLNSETPLRTSGGPMDVALYVLLDSVVDGYFPLLDRFSDRIEAVELRVFEGGRNRIIVRDLLGLRRELLQLRRQLGPTRDVVNMLARRELDRGESGIGAYFLDVYDHVVRTVESADLYHDIIGSALDASVSVSSYRLNETMRTMTALATILMSMALVTGVYGMNFDVMPELRLTVGYPLALVMMAAVGVAVALVFRRRGWL